MPSVDTKNRNSVPVEHPPVAVATEAFSAALHGHMDGNARAMMEINQAIWKNFDAAVATGGTAGQGIRTATENAAEQSGQQAHNFAVAGEAFARAKSPAEFVALQQDLFRSSSADMAAGMRKNGEMLTQAIRAISENWRSIFSSVTRKDPTPKVT